MNIRSQNLETISKEIEIEYLLVTLQKHRCKGKDTL